MKRPSKLNGLRHLALIVPNLEECERFYIDTLGMSLLYRAHTDLVYFTCGNDNLSLGRGKPTTDQPQALDHFGFVVDSKELLDQWYTYLLEAGVSVLDTPHDHTDGARSFHIKDPAGNVIQPIYHPAISGQSFTLQAD